MDKSENTGWVSKEFGEIDLGDQRLADRLVKLADKLASSPESPINQACGDWANTKAAYRFFQNERIDEKIILQSHIDSTFERAKEFGTILAIQDTSFLNLTDHKKTTGLGIISKYPTKKLEIERYQGFGYAHFICCQFRGASVRIIESNYLCQKTIT